MILEISIWERDAKRATGYVATLLAVVLFLAPALFLGLGADHSSAATPTHQDRDALVGTMLYHQVIAVQGDDPSTELLEQEKQITVLDRTQWSIPRNTEEIFIPVPEGAKDVVIEQVEHQGLTIYQPGAFSREKNPDTSFHSALVTEGKWTGYYSWRFPEGVNRDTSSDLAIDTDDDFEFFDENFTTAAEWTIDGGSLSLAPGVEEGIYTSPRYIAGNDILSIFGLYSMSGDPGNMTVQVSEDNGTTWVDLANDAYTAMTDEGPNLRWRVLMNQDVSLNNTPVLERLDLSVTYLTINTVIWIQTDYQLEIPDDGIDWALEFTFDFEATILVFIGYFDDDYEVTIFGTEMTMGTSDNYPDKTYYRKMGGAYESIVTLRVEPPSDSDGEANFLLIVGLPLVIILVVIIAFVALKRTPRSTTTDGDEPDDDGEGADERDAEPVEDVEELEAEKERLLGEISRLDNELEDGTIDEDKHGELRDEYKAQAVEVMKRLKAAEDDSTE